MSKNLITIAAACAMLSLGMLASAQAGGTATSAPSKYNGNHSNHAASVNQNRERVGITEFSSSSAPTSAPKR